MRNAFVIFTLWRGVSSQEGASFDSGVFCPRSNVAVSAPMVKEPGATYRIFMPTLFAELAFLVSPPALLPGGSGCALAADVAFCAWPQSLYAFVTSCPCAER